MIERVRYRAVVHLLTTLPHPSWDNKEKVRLVRDNDLPAVFNLVLLVTTFGRMCNNCMYHLVKAGPLKIISVIF